MKIEPNEKFAAIEVSAATRENGSPKTLRLLDILLSTLGLIACLPILVVISALIKLDSPGPVLFQQARHGLDKKIFNIYKFRTMTRKASKDIFRQAIADDKRVTRFGRFLRRTSLDELPQLFNVLLGDMSLVGPRPHPIELDNKFEMEISFYNDRFSLRPGITGLAQVRGYRGPTETLQKMTNRVTSDIEYISLPTVRLYFKILVQTVSLILLSKNLRGH